jgi:hypothetical protein
MKQRVSFLSGSETITRVIRVCQRTREIRWLLVLLIPNLWLSFLTATSFVAPSFGWFHALADVAEDKVMYKDFFVPFPPVAIWIEGSLSNFFNDSLFVDSVKSILVWQIFCLILFKVSKTIFSTRDAVFGTLIATLFYFAYPVNRIAGYYELHLAVVLLACFFTIQVTRTNLKRHFYLSGLAAGLLPLIKQSSLPVSVVLMAYLVIGLAFQRQLLSQRGAYLASGFLTIPVCVFAWTLMNSNFFQMISNLSGSAKSPSLMRVITWGTSDVLTSSAVLPWLIATTLVVKTLSLLRDDQVSKINTQMFVLVLSITAISIYNPEILLTPTSLGPIYGPFTGLTILVVILLLVINKIPTWSRYLDRNEKTISTSIAAAMTPLVLVVLPFSAFTLNSDLATEVTTTGNAIAASLGLGAAMFTVLLLVDGFGIPRNLNGQWIGQPGLLGTQQFPSAVFVVAITLLALALGNSMSAGPTGEAWTPSVALLFSCVSSLTFAFVGRWRATVVGSLLLAPLMFVFMIRPITEPYSWWALKEPRLEAKKKALDFGRLRGISVNESEFLFWSRLDEVLKSRPSSAIFAGPNIAGIPYMLGRETAINNCVIVWWDVCPEDYAAEDLTWLKETTPSLMLWLSPSEYVIKGHEDGFRSGEKSTIREMDVWFQDSIAQGRLRVLDSIPISNSESTLKVLEPTTRDLGTK